MAARLGKIDIAGTHLNEPVAARKVFCVVTFALWEEGFVVRRGNPKAIRRVEDLANPQVRNSSIASQVPGSRRLFETLMGSAGMSAAKVKGSQNSVPGHLEAAWAVASGAADCCIAAGSAARRFGLDFVPLAAERFELVLHKRDLKKKAVQGVLDILNRARFRRQLEVIAGYDVSHAGEKSRIQSNAWHTGRVSQFLVTGGAGFIGSALVRGLIACGAKRMVVVDNLLTGHARNLDEVRGAIDFHHVDIRDYDALRKAMTAPTQPL